MAFPVHESPKLEYGEHILTIETELYSDPRETWLLLSMSRPNLEYGEHVLTIETELYSDSRETWLLLPMSRQKSRVWLTCADNQD